MARQTNAGDELAGDRIFITARDIDTPRLSTASRTHRHKLQQTIARDNVLCVIEQPFKWVLEKAAKPSQEK